MTSFVARSIMLKLDSIMEEHSVSMELQQKLNVALHAVFDEVCPGWDYDG